MDDVSPVLTRVAIAVPTFNKAPLLRSALRSILAQQHVELTVFVVDDGSTDNTETVVHSFHDSRLSYTRNDRNLGLTGNWNRCRELLLASGATYIAIYHDDDWYADCIAAREAHFLASHPAASFVYVAAAQSVPGGAIIQRPYPHDVELTARQALDDLCLRGIYYVSTPAVMARRDAYERAGAFDPTFRICPDLDLWWRMLEFGTMGFLADTLYVQRIHNGQVSGSRPALEQAVTQSELLSVLDKAVARLAVHQPDLNVALYQELAHHYCSRQCLNAGKALLEAGHYAAVAVAVKTAVRLDHGLSARAKATALLTLNHPLGRAAVRVGLAAYRAVRDRTSSPLPAGFPGW